MAPDNQSDADHRIRSYGMNSFDYRVQLFSIDFQEGDPFG